MEENEDEPEVSQPDSGPASSIVTVSELIDSTFGEPDANTVHHKQLQAVLYLLARQLRLLERKVTVKLKPGYIPRRHSSSSISITEVKLQIGKAGGGESTKKGQRGTKGRDEQAASSGLTSSDKYPSSKATSGVDKQSAKSKMDSDKSYGGSGGKASSGGRTSTGATTSDKVSNDLMSPSDKKSSKQAESGKGSSGVKTTTTRKLTDADDDYSYAAEQSEKSKSRDKSSSGEKSSAGRKSSPDDNASDTDEDSPVDKTSKGGKTSSKAKSSPGDESSRDKKTPGGGKSSPDGKTSDGDETSTVVKASKSGKTSSGDKSTRDKKPPGDKSSTSGQSSSDVETGGKTSTGGKSSAAGVGKSSTRDKTSAGVRTSPDDRSSPSDKTSTAGRSGKTIATDITSTADEASIAGDDASSETTGTGRTPSGRILGGKSATEKSGRSTTAKSGRQSKLGGPSIAGTGGGKLDPQDYQQILDEVEVMRERELRVIRQRADSREERERTPTPIASMESVEVKYEKLLVVERLPAEEAAARAAKTKSGQVREPKVSVVTLEQFKKLASIVEQLQDKLRPIGVSGFPENIELMQELRKGASLTDAMAALQLSARLEATEKTLTNLLSLVTDMATQMPGFQPSGSKKDKIEVLFGAVAKDSGKENVDTKEDKVAAGKSLADAGVSPGMGSGSGQSALTQSVAGVGSDDMDMKQGEMVTYEELENQLRNVEKDIMKQVTTVTDRSIASARAAKNMVAGLEQKVDNALALGTRMNDLETLVANYAEQINILDTGLSSQLTNFQEELTQMQHDLETGLENMAEVLANTGGDATAVAELNGHFNNLQIEIDDAIERQIDLRQIQRGLSMDLDGLRRQIEILRDTKSDREEVADALRDKAGLSDLNGLISIMQFEAVIGDLEKRLAAAYDKFNNQEIVWQKAIDEVLRELNEKADMIQVDNLREQIAHYLELLRKRIQFIVDIVGEPVAAALVRKINRDGACLSCSAPAHMEIEQTTMPNLPAMKGHGADAAKGDGDHGVCYPGLPIRHPVDPRAHICNRWCGGSHTKIDVTTRVPPSFTITPLHREVGLAKGTDGKMYVVDKTKEPCSQCQPQVPPSPQMVTPSASEHAEEVDYQNVEPTDSVSLELLPAVSGSLAADDENATPPIIDMQSSLCLK